jgi:hypothetical protein
VNRDIYSSIHGDRIVLLDVARGEVLIGNSVAAAVWEALTCGNPLNQLAVELSNRYVTPVDRVRHDITSFVATLQASRMVTEC